MYADSVMKLAVKYMYKAEEEGGASGRDRMASTDLDLDT